MTNNSDAVPSYSSSRWRAACHVGLSTIVTGPTNYDSTATHSSMPGHGQRWILQNRPCTVRCPRASDTAA
jgi:hypothetical protein